MARNRQGQTKAPGRINACEGVPSMTLSARSENRAKCGLSAERSAGTSIPRFAISAQRPHIRFALPYGLVHARARAGIRNSTPGQVGPLSTPCASAAALVASSLKREKFRMGSTPLFMMSAILVEHHSETNAGTFITFVTKPVQTLALT